MTFESDPRNRQTNTLETQRKLEPQVQDALSRQLDAEKIQKVGELASSAHQLEDYADRSHEIFQVRRDPDTFEVEVTSDLTLDDYKKITPEKDWELLVETVSQLEGKTITFINPTMAGGGVAMLRPPLVHMLRQFGVDARWYVMQGKFKEADPNPFDFTKLMHNISQRRLPDDVRITESGKAIHWQWCERNADVLQQQQAVRNADIIMIDDPQPAPLKAIFAQRGIAQNSKWVWRNHIDTNYDLIADPSTPQAEVARYIMEQCQMKDTDAVMCHPVPAFIHPGMENVTYFGPATAEPHDDLNRKLSPSEIQSGIQRLNRQIQEKNDLLTKLGRGSEVQSLIDTDRKRIVIIARFDPSKGMKKAMRLGVMTREIMREHNFSGDELPQIILLGNGSVDDPDGKPLLEEKLRIKREEFIGDKEDIIILRAKHDYAAINAMMYPTGIPDGSDTAQVFALQTSDAEGCETRISDWIAHGVPVMIANRGGMPLQVQEGVSGHILEYGKTDSDLENELRRGAELLAGYMMNPQLYGSIRKSTLERAEHFNDREFTTTANVTRLGRIFNDVLSGKVNPDKVWKIEDMLQAG